jgi:hypothetical protein
MAIVRQLIGYRTGGEAVARKQKGAAERRSRHWLQVLVNQRPDAVDPLLLRSVGAPPVSSVQWLSPLQADGYAEYSDADFLRRLGCPTLAYPLECFWPKGGPEWDGLAKTSDGRLVLVEAKAHIPEAVSSPTGATEPAASIIRKSLDDTKTFLGSTAPCDWATAFYQYTNRLAHLYFLRELNRQPAFLVFIYFTHAPDVPDAPSEEEWRGALRLLHSYIGVGHNRLSPFVVDLFVDARQLAPAA